VLKELRSHTDAVRKLASGFEPGLYSGADAASIFEEAAELGRAVEAIKALAAGRVEETRLHERSGHKTAGQLLAERSREPVSDTVGALEANKAARHHPAIEEGLKHGELSVAQAKEIASAADRDPSQAERLVREAKSSTFSDLKASCSEVRRTSSSAEEEIARYERIRKNRYLRTWTDSEGAGRLDGRLTPDGLAIVKGALERLVPEVEARAREDGSTDRRQALMSDALVAMANRSVSGSSSGSSDPHDSDLHGSDLHGSDPHDSDPHDSDPHGSDPHGTDTHGQNHAVTLRIRVDLQAFLRGHAQRGETCEIPGVGPIPVALARDVLGDALLQVVIADGKDVTTCVSDSRRISAALRIALEERDPTCRVPGCEAAENLEIHHYDTEFAKGGPTSMDNLARCCPHHHRLVTHKGWRLSGGPGNWRFDPPESDPPNPDPPGRYPDSATEQRASGPRATGPPVDAMLF
jgi:hypothetical protein